MSAGEISQHITHTAAGSWPGFESLDVANLSWGSQRTVAQRIAGAIGQTVSGLEIQFFNGRGWRIDTDHYCWRTVQIGKTGLRHLKSDTMAWRQLAGALKSSKANSTERSKDFKIGLRDHRHIRTAVFAAMLLAILIAAIVILNLTK